MLKSPFYGCSIKCMYVCKRNAIARENFRVPPFSRGVLSMRARVSLALLSLRKNGDYSQSKNWSKLFTYDSGSTRGLGDQMPILIRFRGVPYFYSLLLIIHCYWLRFQRNKKWLKNLSDFQDTSRRIF